MSASWWTIAHVSDDVGAAIPEEQVVAKWLEIAPGIEKMAQRIGDPDDFAVRDRSSLSGDDKKSAPYCVSHAVRACLVSGVDHLHAAKSLVVDLEMLHASAVYSLLRGSLENLSAAFWILHPQCVTIESNGRSAGMRGTSTNNSLPSNRSAWPSRWREEQGLT
jgi:hypothetical protein